MQAPQTIGRSAGQWGLIFGGIIAVLAIINTLIGVAAGSRSGISGIIGIVFFIVFLVLWFLAGFFTARDSGRVGRATIAGLIAGVIGGVVAGIVGLIVVLTASSQSTVTTLENSGLTASQAHSALLIGGIIGLIGSIIIYAGLGAGFGALGGLAGRGRAQLPQQVYQESLYQGIPPMGQPQPGAGAYPPPPVYPSDSPQQPVYPPQQPPSYPQQ